MTKIKFLSKYLEIAVLITFILFTSSSLVFAEGDMLSLARVSYRPDGGVSITYFLKSYCLSGETETQCIDRIFSTNALKDLPYDDIPISQIPTDREDRDKWRGSKGQGIWIDQNLVTKSEKIEELKEKLDEELDKDNPDTRKVLKLQRQIEKAGDISHSVLTPDDLAQFEERQQSFLAVAVNAIGELFEGILNSLKEGILALKSLVTDKIQVGTSEKPSGITTYDHETGDPYCLIVKKGKVESIPGECGSVIASEAKQSNNNADENNGNSNNNAQETDAEPPTITLIGNSTLEIEIGSIYSDPGATVSDNVNDNLGYKVILSSVIASEAKQSSEMYPNELQINTSEPAEYIIEYIAKDQAGNIGTATRTVNVVDPNQTNESNSTDQTDQTNSSESIETSEETPAEEPAV